MEVGRLIICKMSMHFLKRAFFTRLSHVRVSHVRNQRIFINLLDFPRGFDSHRPLHFHPSLANARQSCTGRRPAKIP